MHISSPFAEMLSFLRKYISYVDWILVVALALNHLGLAVRLLTLL